MENQAQLEDELLHLTVKQVKFVCVYAMNGGKGRQAAIVAEYSSNTATQIAHENLTKPDLQRALAAITHDEVYTTRRVLAARATAPQRGQVCGSSMRS